MISKIEIKKLNHCILNITKYTRNCIRIEKKKEKRCHNSCVYIQNNTENTKKAQHYFDTFIRIFIFY